MFCPKCGKELKEGAKFCGGCGNPVAPAEETISVAEAAPAVETAPVATATITAPKEDVVERAVKKKKKLPTGIKVLIAVLIALIVLGGVFAGLWFGTDVLDGIKPVKTLCGICDVEIEDEEEYCADCIDEYSCKECDEVDKKLDNGYCRKCREELSFCKECDDKIDKGYYCSDCISELGTTESCCAKCGNELLEEEIYLIDKNGYFYCESCDTGNYCTECNCVISADDDDTVCLACAEYSCQNCSEVLEESEIATYDNNENPYCIECQDYAKIADGNFSEYCWSCNEYVGISPAFIDSYGDVYCQSCYDQYGDEYGTYEFNN